MLSSQIMLYIIILLLLIITIVDGQSAFNIYKAYDKSNKRPPQYATNRKKITHPINEYLSPQQRQMAKIRSSPQDAAEDMWSPQTLNGFNQYKKFAAEGVLANDKKAYQESVRRRYLIGAEELEIERDNIMEFDFQYNPLIMGLSFICVSVLAILGIFVFRTRKPIDI